MGATVEQRVARGADHVPRTGMVNGAVPDARPALPPLRVAGLVVRKADLVEALRVAYAPGLREIQVTEDGEHYWLLLDGGAGDGDPLARQEE